MAQHRRNTASAQAHHRSDVAVRSGKHAAARRHPLHLLSYGCRFGEEHKQRCSLELMLAGADEQRVCREGGLGS